MDAYRAYSCGRCRSTNPRGANDGYPPRSRCVTPEDNMCKKPYIPDCERNRQKSCECEDSNQHMRHMPVGIGYVPMQKWEEMYDPKKALCEGTAFPSLNLIFCGKRG